VVKNHPSAARRVWLLAVLLSLFCLPALSARARTQELAAGP
jgi:hypothetical protein